MNATLTVLAKVTRGLGEPAVLLDTALGLVEANAAFSDLTGVRLRHVLRDGRAALDLLRHESGDARRWAQEALVRRSTLRLGEVKVRAPDGATLTVHQTFTPVEDPDGALVGILVTWRNVTEESRLQEHFRELLRQEKLRAEALESAVQARTRDLLLALEQVTRLSRTDALTGVLNRRSFTDDAGRILRQTAEAEGRVGILLFDLDHFKSINDRHGHLAGDRVLEALAAALGAALAGTDLFARFGGEEFIALVRDRDGEALVGLAERCCEAVRALDFGELVPGAAGRLTVSVGVASYPEDGRTLDELMLRADQALYAAKAAGRDRVRRYAPGLSSAPAPG